MVEVRIKEGEGTTTRSKREQIKGNSVSAKREIWKLINIEMRKKLCLALSYYLNFVIFFILVTWLISLVFHQCQRGRLLISNWNKLIFLQRRRLLILKRVSIIFLSLISNLLLWVRQLLIWFKYYHVVDC